MKPKGTAWHPHRGFETVTYMIDGVMQHHDSIGSGGDHRERLHAVDDRRRRHPPHRATPEGLVSTGGLFHGVQLWVNLPAKDKMMPAAYQEHRGRGREARALSPMAARCCGSSPATSRAIHGPGSTHTPINYVHATMAPRGRTGTAVAGRLQRARLRAQSATAPSDRDRQPVGTGQLAVLRPRHVKARSSSRRTRNRRAAIRHSTC